MKNYFACFILTAALTVTLSGCETEPSVRTPVYTDNMPSLTAVPWDSSVPKDTYSQYMETYTEPTTTDSDALFAYSRPQNVLMDTAAPFGRSPQEQGITAPPRDTMIVTSPPVSNDQETYTETATINDWENGNTEETSATETTAPVSGSETTVTETTTTEKTTVFRDKVDMPPKVSGIYVSTAERPPNDTVHNPNAFTDIPNVPADTVFKNNKNNGGTDNADKYTE